METTILLVFGAMAAPLVRTDRRTTPSSMGTGIDAILRALPAWGLVHLHTGELPGWDSDGMVVRPRLRL
jgi:hypothetical protein